MPRVLGVSVPDSPNSRLWPGHQPYSRMLLGDMTKGFHANVSPMTIDAHFGTHVDASRHLVADGETTESLDPDLLVGLAPDAAPALIAPENTPGDAA